MDVKIDTKEHKIIWNIPLNTRDLVTYLCSRDYETKPFIIDGILIQYGIGFLKDDKFISASDIKSSIDKIISDKLYKIGVYTCDAEEECKSHYWLYNQDNVLIAHNKTIELLEFKSLRIEAKFTPRIIDYTSFDYMKNGKFTDVTLQLEDKEYKCHQIVLSSTSTYFATMFNSKFSEASAIKDSSKIVIDGCSIQVFDIIIEYIYTKVLYIPDSYNEKSSEIPDFIVDILLASKLFSLDKLATKCIDILKIIASHYNIEQMILRIKDLDLPELMEIYIAQISKMANMKNNDVFISKILDVPLKKVKVMRTIISTH